MFSIMFVQWPFNFYYPMYFLHAFTFHIMCFLSPTLKELSTCNSDSLTNSLRPTDICSGSLYLSLTYSGAPGNLFLMPWECTGDTYEILWGYVLDTLVIPRGYLGDILWILLGYFWDTSEMRAPYPIYNLYFFYKKNCLG